MELFRLLGSIIVNNTEANKAIEETTEEGQKAEKKLKDSFSKIGQAVKNFGKHAGDNVKSFGKTMADVGKKAVNAGKVLATGIGVAGGAVIAMIESTRDYRTEMGKLEAAFTSAGHSTEAATNTYKSLQSVLGETEQAVEAANHLAKLVDNEKDLQTWTDICTGVYATFGASLPIEGLTEAANETARTGTLTGGLVDALNWAGVHEEKFQAQLDACSTQQERQALITETLNGLYKGTAESYKEINKDVLAANTAQERMTSAMSKFSAILEPVVSAGKLAFAELLEGCLPFAEELAENIPAAIEYLQGIWESILKPVLNFIAEAIQKIVLPAIDLLVTSFKKMAEGASENFGWMRDLISGIFDVIGGIITAFTDLVSGDWAAFWETVLSIILDIGEPIYNAGREIFNQLWDGLKSIWSSISSWVSDKVGWIADKFNTVKSFLAGIKDAVLGAASSAASVQAEKKGGTANVKAHAEGGILTKPTIFGFTPSTGTFHLGGEAGPEAIAPIDKLQGYVKAAVAEGTNTEETNRLLAELIGLQKKMIQVIGNAKIELDGREFGRMVKEYA